MKKVIIILLMSCLAYSPVIDRDSFPNNLNNRFIKSYECDDHIHKTIEAGYCPKCGSFSLTAVPGHYEIVYSCSDFCSHGYANGVDIGYERIYHSAYIHCTNCGYSSPHEVSAPEWVVECHGYN